MTTSNSKLHILKNPLLSLLQRSKTTSQIHQIHAQLITTNFISDRFAASQLLISITSSRIATMMYYAELVFTQIQEPNTFISNTMIKGHVQSSQPKRALQIYVEMRKNGHFGDNYTYPILLKACGMMGGLVEGRGVHGEVLKGGFGCDVFVVNGLIGMYCKCGETGCGKVVFDGFFEKDLVSWNSMLGGFVGCGGDMGEAQRLFDEMPEKDVVSWSIMIDGYSKKLGDVVRARLLFDSMPTRDLVSWNSMIDGYAKVGEMLAARQLFDRMPKKNVISWSIMLDGYAKHGDSKEAMNMFRQMLCQGFKPDKVSVVGALMACGQLGALDQGRWIHTFMMKRSIQMDMVVQTALVDMYMKCGSLDEACCLFNSMPKRNVISWNVMIVGLGTNGFGEVALKCFTQMETEGVSMDDLIFLGVLTACSHAGLVNEGLHIFDLMKRAYRIQPKLEHYGCLVDLLGRAGQLDEAQNVIETMPMKPNKALWGSLLLACRTNKHVALAEIVVQRLVELKADDCGVYVLMSNLYADVGMWEGVQRVRKLMKDRDMKKETGKSIIEVEGRIEEFVGGEKTHSRIEEIQIIIWSLLKTSVFAELSPSYFCIHSPSGCIL